MKKPGLAFVEFLPAYDAEIALLRAAEELTDGLVVALLSDPSDPIDAEIRAGWIRDVVPSANVIPFSRDLFASPDVAHGLKAIVRQSGHGSITRLVSLTADLQPIANEIGADFIALDPEKEIFRFDLPTIRDDVLTHWDHIDPAARSLLRRRITLVGPECSGKSTIGDFLARTYGLSIVPEYGRFHAKLRFSGPYSLDELAFVNDASVALRKAVQDAHGPVILEDTDTLLQMAWAEKLFGHGHLPLAENLELADHYLLFSPDIPWVDDPVRSMTDHQDRRDLFHILRRLLCDHGADYTVIEGPRVKREAESSAALDVQLEAVRAFLR